MKRSLKLMLLVMLAVCLMGCGKAGDNTGITETTPIGTIGEEQPESPSDTETTVNTTETTTKNIPDEERGYGASIFRTYADEDMKKLGVEKKLVVICDYTAAALPETITSKFNELLVNKYGCDFVVEFIGFDYAVSNTKYVYDDALYDIKALGQQADLIVTGSGENTCYTTLIEQGFLEELTDVLKDTEDGRMIYEALPPKTWDSIERDGKIYGIAPLMNYYQQHILVCNKEIADSMGIKAKEGFSFYDIGDMLEPVSEKLTEQGLIGCYYYVPSLLRILGYYNIIDVAYNGHGVCAKQNEDGEWTAFNPLMDEEFVKLCRTIREYKEKGWIVSTDTINPLEREKVESGSFVFYADVMMNDEQIAGNEMISDKTGMIEVVVGDMRSHYLEQTEINVTCIASWSQYKEDALKLLRLMQTEEEICNLLTWGIEGEHYIYENREVIQLVSGIRKDAMGKDAVMVNRLLTYPEYLEPDNKVEYYNGIIDNAESGPFMKYGITNEEYLEITEAYRGLVTIYDKYYIGLLEGYFEDVDATIAEALRLQEEEGINELIEKLNKMFESGAAYSE